MWSFSLVMNTMRRIFNWASGLFFDISHFIFLCVFPFFPSSLSLLPTLLVMMAFVQSESESAIALQQSSGSFPSVEVHILQWSVQTLHKTVTVFFCLECSLHLSLAPPPYVLMTEGASTHLLGFSTSITPPMISVVPPSLPELTISSFLLKQHEYKTYDSLFSYLQGIVHYWKANLEPVSGPQIEHRKFSDSN